MQEENCIAYYSITKVMITATRYHDISCGHRVVGQGGKCEHLHGHNYRIYFTCQAPHNVTGVDSVGRVLDFSEIKNRLCKWLEESWDHRFLTWEHDPLLLNLCALDPLGVEAVPFNPTAENMAQYLVQVIGPEVLNGTGVELIECTVEETRKCYATYKLPRKGNELVWNTR